MNKHEFIAHVIEQWEKVPQLRFGQFLYNALNGQDMFYISNEVLLYKLQAYIERTTKTGLANK